MRILTLAAAAAITTTLSAGTALAACDDGEMILKFSHVANNDRHPKGLAANRFAERVNAEMDGVACMEVFPSSQLYNDDVVLEAMLQGDVEFAAPSLSKFETFTRRFRIFDLPFMFDDIEHVNAFQGSEMGQELMRSMERRGILGLAFWHNGMKQMSANRPLNLPSDAEGLRFRVQQSDVLVAQMEALGASAQKLAFSEVYGALQLGTVDAQENTWSNIYGQKFYEVQDGITETNHGIIDYLVVVSVDWWEGLEPEVRDQLSTILAEVTLERNEDAFRVNQEARQGILDAGGEIRQLTPEQRQAWVDAMLPVWDQFVDDVGQETIDAVRAMAGES